MEEDNFIQKEFYYFIIGILTKDYTRENTNASEGLGIGCSILVPWFISSYMTVTMFWWMVDFLKRR